MRLTVGACPACKHSTCTVEVDTYEVMLFDVAKGTATCSNEACSHTWTVEIEDYEAEAVIETL